MSATRARVLTLALIAIAGAAQVAVEAPFLFSLPAVELMRSVYQTNPFLEAPEIGRYLAQHAQADDRVAVLGSEPEILFYAQRTSATGYIYMYPLTEHQPFAPEMQQDLIATLQAARPRYVVLVDEAASWVSSRFPDNRIVTWANTFTSTCHTRVGIVDVNPAGESTIKWDEDAAGYQPRFKSKVTIYRRTGGPGC